MNIRIILFVLGKLAQACGLALMIPFVVALFYGESSLMAFLVAIVISLFLGRLFMGQGHRPTDSLTVREGVAITALGWIMITLLGIGYYFKEHEPNSLPKLYLLYALMGALEAAQPPHRAKHP